MSQESFAGAFFGGPSCRFLPSTFDVRQAALSTKAP